MSRTGKNMNLDKKRMNVVKTAKTGKVNHETIFEFHQEGSIVTAHYAGGKILQGFLVGKINENKLEFRYSQIDSKENLDGGFSLCEMKKLENGKIQLVEHFQWESIEGAGENIIEEL